jgi:DNA-binding NarL/FixJ family response regulator
MNNEIKILIAEDHHLVAKLLSANLEMIEDFDVIAMTQDGQEAIDMTAELMPDVLLLDIDMPVLDGMQALKEIRKKNKKTRIIIVSNHTEGWLIQKSLLAGANGFITKFAESDELVEAVYSVIKGIKYLCKLSRQHVQNETGLDLAKSDQNDHEQLVNDSFTARYQRLTKREKEIFKLIVEGHSTKELAEILYISVRTVETHRKNILKKLEIRASVEIIKEAMASGIFQSE